MIRERERKRKLDPAPDPDPDLLNGHFKDGERKRKRKLDPAPDLLNGHFKDGVFIYNDFSSYEYGYIYKGDYKIEDCLLVRQGEGVLYRSEF